MRFTFARIAPLWATLICTSSAHAAASLLVDDASTTPAGECQIESWYQWHGQHQEISLVPACTVAGTEWSAGVSDLRGAHATAWTLGAKRTVRGHHDARVRIAVAAGIGGDLRAADARGWALDLPVSVALDPVARVLLHAGIGWGHAPSARGLTLGVGSEIQLTPHWSVIAEQARDATRQRGTQIGLRRTVRDSASLDFIAGRAHGTGADNWITVGVNLPLAR